jgi:hypothetical protein
MVIELIYFGLDFCLDWGNILLTVTKKPQVKYMQNTIKVSHFKRAPSLRLLEMYCSNITNKIVSTPKKTIKTMIWQISNIIIVMPERIIRWGFKKIGITSCYLLCGRSGKTSVKFTIIESTFISDGIWHVKGILGDQRRVTLEVNKVNDTCDIIVK